MASLSVLDAVVGLWVARRTLKLAREMTRYHSKGCRSTWAAFDCRQRRQRLIVDSALGASCWAFSATMPEWDGFRSIVHQLRAFAQERNVAASVRAPL